MFSILHRMIFRELVRVFLLSLLSITSLLLLAGIVAEASQQGLKPSMVLAAIPLLVPSTLPYTVPATTLFAVCVVYGRLAADNEILALRAGGISTLTVVWPGVFLGLTASAATLGLYYHAIPSTHLLLRAAIFEDAEEMLYIVLSQDHQITLPHSDYSIYVQDVQGRRLINAAFKRRDRHDQTDMAAVAREAELRVDLQRQVILVHMRHGEIWSPDGARAQFQDRIFDLPLPEEFVTGPERRPRDMNWEELYLFRTLWTNKMAGMQDEIDESNVLAESGRSDLQTHIGHLRNKIKQLRKQILGIGAEEHMRPALALGCFFFVLIGCPVGIWLSRSDYLSAFLVCFLPIILVYYPLLLCGTGLAKAGHIGPALSVWAADALMGLAGVCLFRRLARN